jgi:hypothetical protein
MSRPRKQPDTPAIRCAIYTRKSCEEGLDLEFNSLDAQRESAEAYIASQQHEGWTCLAEHYDDGGFSGGSMERPALNRLLADIEAGKIDCVVVNKVDRLSRSLLDFARIMETFEQRKISFVSVTQQFNTATSMGRLVLNVLLSFAQFEREIIGERNLKQVIFNLLPVEACARKLHDRFRIGLYHTVVSVKHKLASIAPRPGYSTGVHPTWSDCFSPDSELQVSAEERLTGMHSHEGHLPPGWRAS